MLYSLSHDLFWGAAPVIDDAALLAAGGKFDSRALAAIHDRYYPGLYRYLFYRTGDDHVAEDLCSEVFMRLLDALRAGRPPASLRGWLFGVAAHLAADHYRQQNKRPQSALTDEIPAAEDDPESEVGARAALRALRMALLRLTDEQQQVLAMRFDEGRSIAETAALMQKSETAVKQLQFRAVAALRRMLKDMQ